MIRHRRLGEILVERGLLESSLEQALAVQKLEPETRLGVALVRLGVVTEEDVAVALAEQKSLDYIDPLSVQIEPALIWRVPRRLAEQRQLMPLRRLQSGAVLVAMADPSDADALRELEFSLGSSIHAAVASPSRLRRAIYRHYSIEPVAERMLKGVTPELRRLTRAPSYLELDTNAIQAHLQQGQSSQTYIDLVNFLLINAIERGASDLHLEPQADGLRVRMRIDGMLREAVRLPTWAQDSITSRIKVIGKMDVAERRRPQDGKVTANLAGHQVELRIATLPSQYGEAVVVRVLDPRMVRQDLGALGWRPEGLQRYYQLLGNPRGLTVVCGPTGSGKSTTLYATIHRLNNEQTSIVTIEDPVEYSLPGITQVQVDEKAGVTFSDSVKALLRQDPNVLVIGEIRDTRTAAAAVDAATTGHLVLSTLHTSNVVSAVTRLRDLGVPDYMLGAAVSGLVAQRLLRRVCRECSTLSDPAPEDWMRLGLKAIPIGGSARRVGPGCPYCQYMGYSGRVGAFEMLIFDQQISTLVQRGAAEAELWDYVQTEGYTTLFEDALRRVQEGETTLEELARVVPVADYPSQVVDTALRRLMGYGTARDARRRHRANAPLPLPVEALEVLPSEEVQELPVEAIEVIPEAPVEVLSGAGDAGEGPAPTGEAVATAPAEAPEEAPGDAPTEAAVPAARLSPAAPTWLPQEEPAPARQMRPEVLVVDDADEIIQLVSLTLEDDYAIRTARDGVEAMEAVAARAPDLIVLDVMMPRMSGYEVCNALKEDAATAKIPVIFLSARGETAHIKKGFYAGADDYLPKPFDPEELMLRARALLRRAGWKV
jgi:type IV pilus assembly protein PilB